MGKYLFSQIQNTILVIHFFFVTLQPNSNNFKSFMKTTQFKHFMLLIAASIMLILSSCAPDPVNPWEGNDNSNTSSTKLIGYCGNNIDVNIAAGQMARLGGGTTLPKAVFGDSKYIVGARVYIGAAATDTKIFISADLQTNLYEQPFEVIPNAWNYIKFTTPFELNDSLAGV